MLNVKEKDQKTMETNNEQNNVSHSTDTVFMEKLCQLFQNKHK